VSPSQIHGYQKFIISFPGSLTLYKLCSWNVQVAVDRRGACGTYRGEEWCIESFGWEKEGKISLGKSRCRWKNNFKKCL